MSEERCGAQAAGADEKMRRAIGRGSMRDWQRQYRLSKERWHYQMVRLDHEDIQMLRSLAEREGTTVSELLRMFVAWGLEELAD
jgi:hypothetical protein